MKLRTLKKCIHRKKSYKHEPMYLTKIFGIYDKDCDYYTCHKVEATYFLESRKLIINIKRKD